MPMHFFFSLTCQQCTTVVRFEDERPEWQTYDYNASATEAIERSARFATEHADCQWESEPQGLSPCQQHLYRLERPVFLALGPDGHYRVSVPEPYLYISCPVCDAHLRRPLGYD